MRGQLRAVVQGTMPSSVADKCPEVINFVYMRRHRHAMEVPYISEALLVKRSLSEHVQC